MSVSLTPPQATVPSYLSPTVAFIHLSALAHNLAALRRHLNPSCEIMAIVKADGYGHGSIRIAETLARLGIRKFGVSTIQEGVILREAGLEGTIIVLGGIFPHQIGDLLHYKLTPVISDSGTAHHLVEVLQSQDVPLSVHVKVDTGMNRLGFSPEAILNILGSSFFNGPLKMEGLMTHLADADNPHSTFTLQQLESFESITKRLQDAGIRIPCIHAANTAGIVSYPQSHGNMVRPGLLLYGYLPNVSPAQTWSLQPILTLSTKIVQLKTVQAGEPISYNGIFRTTRTSRIGILPIGYAHGYSRRLSNRGEVLVQGKRVPIIGRICMDMTLIDVTEVPNVQTGDAVILLGNQGDDSITAADIATWMDSVPYEVLCGLGPRVNRVYEPMTEEEKGECSTEG